MESVISAQAAKEEKPRECPTITVPSVAHLMAMQPNSAARDLLQSQINVLVEWYHPTDGEMITRRIMSEFEHKELRDFLIQPSSLQPVIDEYHRSLQIQTNKTKESNKPSNRKSDSELHSQLKDAITKEVAEHALNARGLDRGTLTDICQTCGSQDEEQLRYCCKECDYGECESCYDKKNQSCVHKVWVLMNQIKKKQTEGSKRNIDKENKVINYKKKTKREVTFCPSPGKGKHTPIYEKATTARRAGDDEKGTEEETFEIVSYETVTAMVAKRIAIHEKQAAQQIKTLTTLKQKRQNERYQQPHIDEKRILNRKVDGRLKSSSGGAAGGTDFRAMGGVRRPHTSNHRVQNIQGRNNEAFKLSCQQGLSQKAAEDLVPKPKHRLTTSETCATASEKMPPTISKKEIEGATSIRCSLRYLRKKSKATHKTTKDRLENTNASRKGCPQSLNLLAVTRMTSSPKRMKSQDRGSSKAAIAKMKTWTK